MLRTCVIFAAAVALGSAAAAQVQSNFSLGAPKPAPIEPTKEQVDQAIAQCQTRRFETAAEYQLDGQRHRAAVRMCAAVGETDAQWINRLEKTAVAVEARPGLPDDARAKLVADLRGEVARLKVLKASEPPASASASAAIRSAPGIATAAKPQVPLLGKNAPKPAPLAAADALVATVPAMPAPLPPQKDLPIGTVPASMLVPPPPLSITCLEEGEHGEGLPCSTIRGWTVLAVKADGDLKGPATLRFLRRDQERGAVPIRALRQGQLVEVKLPPGVCSGVVRSELAIEIVTGTPASGNVARAAATKGPYDLHC